MRLAVNSQMNNRWTMSVGKPVGHGDIRTRLQNGDRQERGGEDAGDQYAGDHPPRPSAEGIDGGRRHQATGQGQHARPVAHSISRRAGGGEKQSGKKGLSRPPQHHRHRPIENQKQADRGIEPEKTVYKKQETIFFGRFGLPQDEPDDRPVGQPLQGDQPQPTGKATHQCAFSHSALRLRQAPRHSEEHGPQHQIARQLQHPPGSNIGIEGPSDAKRRPNADADEQKGERSLQWGGAVPGATG